MVKPRGREGSQIPTAQRHECWCFGIHPRLESLQGALLGTRGQGRRAGEGQRDAGGRSGGWIQWYLWPGTVLNTSLGVFLRQAFSMPFPRNSSRFWRHHTKEKKQLKLLVSKAPAWHGPPCLALRPRSCHCPLRFLLSVILLTAGLPRVYCLVFVFKESFPDRLT